MKLYVIELNNSFSYVDFLSIKQDDVNKLDIKWEKDSQYPNYKYNPSTDAEIEEQAELKANWEILSIEEVLQSHPSKATISWGNRQHIITEDQFDQMFKFCELKNILHFDDTSIDLEKLADLIITKLKTKEL